MAPVTTFLQRRTQTIETFRGLNLHISAHRADSVKSRKRDYLDRKISKVILLSEVLEREYSPRLHSVNRDFGRLDGLTGWPAGWAGRLAGLAGWLG